MRQITYWLSLVMIFVIPWENVVDIEGLGTISRLIGLIVAGVWGLNVLITGTFRKPHPFHFVFALFVSWNAMTLLWSYDVDETLETIITYLQLFGMMYILWDLYVTPSALNAGLQAYVLGGYVSMVSLLSNYQAGAEASYQRFSAAGFNGNDLALILALGMPLAWHLAVSGRGNWQTNLLKLVNYGYIPAAFAAIMLTSSRSAFFATIPVVLYMLASLNQLRPHIRVAVFGIVLVSLIALIPFIPEASIQRIADTGAEVSEGDLNNRTEVWGEAINIIDANPVLGVGVGAFKAAASETGKVAHNIILTTAAESGIVGLLLFMIILVMVGYNTTHLPRWMMLMWLTVLSVWFLGAITHNWEVRKQTWLFLSLVITSAGLYVTYEEPEPEIIWTDRPLAMPNLHAFTLYAPTKDIPLHGNSARDDGGMYG